ncbi:GDPD-domain-containing protein [Tothia fuscella]|uniref:GDPD-domain-containing protein n=1 Tax=Tothia fuscella TaxID=1048955 RepID=A0A9P4NEM0_9PEZI|nr:GDPD-domain-containing protein [Tothia fuscella]
MKFGHNLSRNQVPEWASNYIDYKGLKKLIKAVAQTVKEGGEADLAGKSIPIDISSSNSQAWIEYFYTLDRNLEDVDAFYGKKYAESARRLRLLHERYGKTPNALDGIDRDEVEDLMGALLELRGQLRKLQWYGEVNRRGFIKILKKLDKKVPNTSAQQRYLAGKVNPKQFATNHQLSKDMHAINDWLSSLGEAKIVDDNSSVHSTGSMRTVSSRAIWTLPSGLLDTVDQAIRTDDAALLAELLLETNTGEDTKDPAFQKLLLNLLQRSISCRSKRCMENLLPQIVSLEEEDDLHRRNCIHRLVIAIGRAKSNENRTESDSNRYPTAASGTKQYIVPAEHPVRAPQPCTATELESTKLLSAADESVQFLNYFLDALGPSQRKALQARDTYSRCPLHYAAHYGFVVICKIIIKHMQAWGQFDVSHGIDSPEWQDAEGLAPLHLSVINQHPLTTKTLLDSEKWQGESEELARTRKQISNSGIVLALAAKSNSVTIVKLLVEAGVDINFQDDQGETALHVAARFGHKECAEALIEGSDTQKIDVDITEKTFSWTPLFIACVDGHLPIVELLITAGAELDRQDSSGWTAKEHAALRGHIAISSRLNEITVSTVSPITRPALSRSNSPSPPNNFSLEDRRSNALAKEERGVRVPEPVKTFGHRYLTKETMLLVSLGSMDVRKNMDAVKLDAIPLAHAHATQLDTALSIVVSATGATGEPTVIDLPVQENISTDPITFMTMDVSKVKLLFDIVPTYAGSKDRIVGRGVAILSSIKPGIGSKRMSLQGDVSVPIVSASTLDVIGTVNFNFLVITPFSHPNMSITEQHTYWKSMSSTMVIGHRGLGKNQASRKSLQLGENTIQSFIAAANLGASYVEFDVQLTKDHVPVIYHDFLVSETGIDAPVHTLTLEQFLHVSDSQDPRKSRPPSPTDNLKTIFPGGSQSTLKHRPRAYSVGGLQDNRNKVDMTARMKHTRDFKEKGYKANVRGNFIQAPFTTLEEMFQKLPESIGFNIEMKYPMLHESEEHEMDTYAVELNSFVDSVLTKVYDLIGKRDIIFSSFNPDICLLLSFKQPSIPILFLTDAGVCDVGDVRASSLQEAIRFASRWNLLGVVSAAEPLVTCPRLVRVVKESGLVCVSYGTLNNEPKNVELQVKEGIDAVIVDSVLAIRKGLTGQDSKSITLPVPGLVVPPNMVGSTTSNGSSSESDVADIINGVPIYRGAEALGGVHGAIFSG